LIRHPKTLVSLVAFSFLTVFWAFDLALGSFVSPLSNIVTIGMIFLFLKWASGRRRPHPVTEESGSGYLPKALTPDRDAVSNDG